MTSPELKHLIVQLEAVINQIHAAAAPINGKEQICIVYEQIIALRGVIGELNGGVA